MLLLLLSVICLKINQISEFNFHFMNVGNQFKHCCHLWFTEKDFLFLFSKMYSQVSGYTSVMAIGNLWILLHVKEVTVRKQNNLTTSVTLLDELPSRTTKVSSKKGQ